MSRERSFASEQREGAARFRAVLYGVGAVLLVGGCCGCWLWNVIGGAV